MHTPVGFLRRHAVPECLTLSILSCALLALRVHLSGTQTLGFLAFNLVLAWIPLVISMAMTAWWEHAPRHPLPLLPVGALWLLFFPNAPYILTDFVHLRERPGVPLWLDMLMIFSFALTGCLIGFHSLRVVQALVRSAWGRLAGWLFAAGCLGLTGLGIYLGRFVRLNSWDLFFRPMRVLSEALHSLLSRQGMAFTVVLGTLLVAAYICVCATGSRITSDGRAAR